MNKKLLYLTSTSGVIALITGIYLIKQYKDLKTTFNKHLNPAKKTFSEKKQLVIQRRILQQQLQHQR